MDTEDDLFDADSGNESSAEDEDELSISLEPESSTRDKMETEDFHYDVLSTEQIVQHMIDCIREVNTIVQIPPTITRILLNHFKWDKEKLYERYYDGDQDSLFKEAHIVNPYKKPHLSSKDSSRSCSLGTEECEICLRDIPRPMMTGIACGHRFCTECWKEYLTSKIIDQGMCQIIACAAHGCDILVDDQTVMNLVTDSKVRLKYQQLITNSFVEAPNSTGSEFFNYKHTFSIVVLAVCDGNYRFTVVNVGTSRRQNDGGIFRESCCQALEDKRLNIPEQKILRVPNH